MKLRIVSGIFAILILVRAEAASPVRSLADLVALVERKKIQSVEDLLPHLDEELRRNYSLIFASRSTMRDASYREPRVTLFSDDGKFMIAFAGNPKQVGGTKVEVIEYSASERVNKFGQLDFNGGKLSVLGHHQTRSCLSCHASLPKESPGARIEAHPIWDTYPDWVDRYGSSHISQLINPKANSTSGASYLPMSEFIDNAYQDFLKGAKKNPRYQALIGLQKRSLFDLAEINNRFGNALADVQMEKLAGLIRSSPLYPRYAKAFENVAEESSDFDPRPEFSHWLPAEERARFKRVFPKLEKEVIEGQDRYYRAKRDRFLQFHYPEGHSFDLEQGSRIKDYPYVVLNRSHSFYNADRRFAPRIARLTYLLDQMEIPRGMMELSFERGSFSVSQGRVDFRSLPKTIRRISEIEGISSQLGNCVKERLRRR